MMSTKATALGFAALTAVLVAFQLALAAGAPWGEYAMGGTFPGVYPPPMRVAAIAQAVVAAFIALLVLARAGVALPALAGASRILIWPIVGVLAVGVVLNLITPSGMERLIWAPVAVVLFFASLKVALSR